MRIDKNRIFPYPVYSELVDDYKENDFSLETSIEYDSETAIISLQLSLMDTVIREHLENHQMGLFCHVECSSTKYRELFSLSPFEDEFKYEISIPLSQLNGSVEIMCVIVANEEFLDFHDENISEFYEGSTIHFPIYGTIGYTDTTEFNIVKKLDINGDIPSIFSITVNENEVQKNIEVNYCNDQITIYLPKNEFSIYEEYKGTGVRVKQMMIIIPALTEIIEKLKKDSGEFESFPWYVILEEAVIKKGYESGFADSRLINKESVLIAQELLGDVARDAFAEFDNMNKDKS